MLPRFNKNIIRIILIGVMAVGTGSVRAQSQIEPENPLQPFEFFIGGAWVSETTYQTFEWGVGKLSVKSKLYFLEGDKKTLVGEITWFWHPGENKIKGYGHAINMAMNFFEYTTKFESPTVMMNTFYAYGGQYDGVAQHEKLEFINQNEYLWTYYNKMKDELLPAYSRTFRRENY